MNKRFYLILFWPLLISCTNTPHKVQKRVNSEWKFIFTERKKYIMNHEECDTLHVFFAYYNNTKQKQIIEKVKTSCGCTKVQYKHEPINSKESGNLDVAIDMRGDRGFFLKTIGVYFRGQPPVLLKIIGTIAESNTERKQKKRTL